MHSPTPFRVEGAKVIDANGCTLAHVHARDGFHADALPRDDNAALFAAAPGLLAACEAALADIAEHCREQLDCSPSETVFAEACEQLKAAVNKARGQP
jgi:hypothetical protein